MESCDHLCFQWLVSITSISIFREKQKQYTINKTLLCPSFLLAEVIRYPVKTMFLDSCVLIILADTSHWSVMIVLYEHRDSYGVCPPQDTLNICSYSLLFTRRKTGSEISKGSVTLHRWKGQPDFTHTHRWHSLAFDPSGLFGCHRVLLSLDLWALCQCGYYTGLAHWARKCSPTFLSPWSLRVISPFALLLCLTYFFLVFWSLRTCLWLRFLLLKCSLFISLSEDWRYLGWHNFSGILNLGIKPHMLSLIDDLLSLFYV